ncbi:MAG TPA: GNAT family N-acetyltransferase, partial [Acidimicrobiales bacterium]|nr:GNAT family N-acetyltransferase [Acidimicrobiales bacterium]
VVPGTCRYCGREVASRAKGRSDVLTFGRERVRTGPWRGDGQVAYLAPVAGAPAPSPGFLQRCLGELAGRGFTTVITAALAAPERHPFYALGFSDQEHLHLLIHDLRVLPPVPPVPDAPLRRARRGDRAPVLEVDSLTFSPFWRLDELGLEQAITATPAARFRVAVVDGEVVGYAITGRADADGYVQRLAVHPGHQRAGLGRALVLDGLHWLDRKGARRAVVNTQVGNEGAYRLYLRLGFRPQPSDLVVLQRELG